MQKLRIWEQIYNQKVNQKQLTFFHVPRKYDIDFNKKLS